MPKNRKNQSAAIRFGPAVKAVVLCLLIGGSAVGYVWQKDQIRQLGLEIKHREITLNQLIRENEKRRNQLEIQRSPAFLESRIKELNLGLVQPQPAQIWRLPEPAVEQPMRSPSAVEIAAQELAKASQQ